MMASHNLGELIMKLNNLTVGTLVAMSQLHSEGELWITTAQVAKRRNELRGAETGGSAATFNQLTLLLNEGLIHGRENLAKGYTDPRTSEVRPRREWRLRDGVVVPVTREVMPTCQHCHNKPAVADARVAGRGWGWFCAECFNKLGCSLGTGNGQIVWNYKVN